MAQGMQNDLMASIIARELPCLLSASRFPLSSELLFKHTTSTPLSLFFMSLE